MKIFHGIASMNPTGDGRLNERSMAELLMNELLHGRCSIYGERAGEPVLLAVLHVQPDWLSYERFDQRIDLILAGDILRDDCPPLTYRLEGEHFAVSGRCSMLPQVCGVDWYLGTGYGGRAGAPARLKFKIAVKEVLREVRTSDE